jgi:UDP-3-O-[3-hydroxymyristoyl] glucosamine N-acyltransferase
MNVKVSQIFETFHAQGILEALIGPDTDITGIAPAENSGPGSLIFVDSPEFVDQAIESSPAAIVTQAKLAESFSSLSATAILLSKNTRLAQALIRQAYADYDHRNIEWPAIHPAATIHHSASIAEDAIIGPGVVIGRNVKIGRASIIKANTVLEQDAVIGEECILHPNVVVSYACELGNRVILKSGCVIVPPGVKPVSVPVASSMHYAMSRTMQILAKTALSLRKPASPVPAHSVNVLL